MELLPGRTLSELLWESLAKKSLRRAIDAPLCLGRFQGIWRELVVPPPSPHPLKTLDWGGVCKNGLQNLEPQGFRGQNLDNKGLAPFFAVGAYTASALAMICSSRARHKVRCHMGAVESLEGQVRACVSLCRPCRDSRCPSLRHPALPCRAFTYRRCAAGILADSDSTSAGIRGRRAGRDASTAQLPSLRDGNCFAQHDRVCSRRFGGSSDHRLRAEGLDLNHQVL